MRKLVALISVLVLWGAMADAYSFTPYVPPAMESNSSSGYVAYPKITKLEQILLNSCYEGDDINSRLARLEKKVFKKTYTSSDLSWRVENLMANTESCELYGISSKELAHIEKQVLGRTYKKDRIENRLSRMEQELLGATQGGKPDERFETLRTAAQNYTNFARSNPLSGINTANSSLKNKIQNVVSGLVSTGGYMTGYTPPISSYGDSYPYGFSSAYNPTYQNYFSPYRSYNSGWNSAYGMQRSYYRPSYAPHCGCGHVHRPARFNSPYSANSFYGQNTSMGAGSGVRILD